MDYHNDPPETTEERSLICSQTNNTVTLLPDADVFEVRDTKDRGCGVFAMKAIRQGSVLFREKPLITMVSSSNADFYLWPELQKLSEEQLATYRGLSYHLDKVSPATFHNLRTRHQRKDKTKGSATQSSVESDAKLFAIWKTNCISIDPNENALDGKAGLFPLFSRINHSCDPNADGHLDDDIKELTMFTTRDVSVGEEITHTYIDLAKYKTKRQRAKQLKNWCFACGCDRCNTEQ